ncbi:MAG: hypothetical protein QM729_21285 [Solirubrobacterales bacterium]
MSEGLPEGINREQAVAIVQKDLREVRYRLSIGRGPIAAVLSLATPALLGYFIGRTTLDPWECAFAAGTAICTGGVMFNQWFDATTLHRCKPAVHAGCELAGVEELP